MRAIATRKWLETPLQITTGCQILIFFNRQDLRGVNLKGANLGDACFIGADLSEADLLACTHVADTHHYQEHSHKKNPQHRARHGGLFGLLAITGNG
jgi:hypothetical protein